MPFEIPEEVSCFFNLQDSFFHTSSIKKKKGKKKRLGKPSDFSLCYKIVWQVGSITWGGLLLSKETQSSSGWELYECTAFPFDPSFILISSLPFTCLVSATLCQHQEELAGECPYPGCHGNCFGRSTPGMVRDLGKGSLGFSAPEFEL